MPKSRAKLNPSESRTLARDIDDVIHASAPAIDATYGEYKDVNREINQLEDLRDNLKDNGQSIPTELRVRLAQGKIRRKELDRRIAAHTRASLRKVRSKLDIIEASPGAAFNRSAISAIKKSIFKIEQKSKRSGADVRPDIQRVMGEAVTLEQDAGVVISRSGAAPKAAHERSKDAQLIAALAAEWQRHRKSVKKVSRLHEDVEWVDAQIRSLPIKFKRGENIRGDIKRVVKRIKTLKDESKMPGTRLKTYAEAKRGIRDFVDAIKEYSKRDVTPAGVDRLKIELENFSRQFPSSVKAEWKKADQRQFASDVRKIRKSLDLLKPKGKRKCNPCIGLHFHGKDADDLLKALESSAKRQARKNPEDSPRSLISKCQKLWDHYCDKPGKTRLKTVMSHLDKMKKSSSKKVLAERSRCLRATNKEAKRLGI